MRTKVKLLDKIFGEDYWIAVLENVWIGGKFEVEFPYPDDKIEIGEEMYIELIS